MTPYLHQTHGRIRVRSDAILHNPQAVSGFIKKIAKQNGVDEIHHRYYAGSVTITFNPNAISAAQLLGLIKQQGWLDELPTAVPSRGLPDLIHSSARIVLKGVIATHLKRSWQGALLVNVINQLAKR